jgi:hypothetical protein
LGTALGIASVVGIGSSATGFADESSGIFGGLETGIEFGLGMFGLGLEFEFGFEFELEAGFRVGSGFTFGFELEPGFGFVEGIGIGMGTELRFVSEVSRTGRSALWLP